MPTYQYVTVSINIKQITNTAEAGTVKFYSYEPISLTTGETIPPNPTASGSATVVLNGSGVGSVTLASNLENPSGLGYGSSYTVKYIGVADPSERLLGNIIIPATSNTATLTSLLTANLPVVPPYVAAQYVDIPSNQIITGVKTFSAAPVLSNGLTVSAGKVATAASVSGKAGLNIPHGTAPSSPSNGDVWTTTSGLFAQVNGSTVQFNTGNATVTSVGLQMPASVFTVSGSPVTSSGTLSAAFANQTAGTVFAAPVGGGTPSFRALTGDDVPVAAGSNQGTVIVGSNINLSSGTISLTGTNVTTALGYTPVNKAGDTMSGTLTLSGNPTGANDAANKAYVDAVAQGLDVKVSCRAISTSNITLSGTQTVDGVALIAGDRILVTGQTSKSANGIYAVASGAWSRTSDASSAATLNTGAFTFIEEGTTYAGTGWVLTTPGPIIVGSTNLTFAQFSSPGVTTAGNGLTQTGTTISALAADSTISVGGTGLSVGSGSITNTHINASAGIADTKLATISTAGKVADTALSNNVVVYNATQAQKTVLAAPNGSNGAASFRTLLGTDIPAATGSAFGTVIVGSNLTNSSGTISLTGTNVTNALTYTPANIAGDTFTGKLNTLASAAGGAGFNLPHGTDPTNPANGDLWTTAAGVYARVSGTTVQISTTVGNVTSVALSMPNIFTVSGSPITTAGTLTATLASQTANQVFAAPNGSNGTPSFRALAGADIPAATGAAFGTVIVGSNITNTSGTISLTGTNVTNALGSQTANYVLAAPNGSNGNASFRALVGADVPVASGSTQGTVIVGSNLTLSSGTVSLTGTNVNNALGYTADQKLISQTVSSLATSHTCVAGEVCFINITTAPAASVILPASAAKDTVIVIKDIGGNLNTYPVTLAASGTDKIDGASSVTLGRAYISLSVISDGAGKWYII